MTSVPDPASFASSDEGGRVRAMRRHAGFVTAYDPNLDAITQLVRDVLGVAICGVTLVDDAHQHVKSIAGEALETVARKDAFCNFTIGSRVPMVVADAHLDARFVNNPLVTGSPFIRSYAGAPLRTSDGYHIGALCVIEPQPRTFSESDLALLQRFSAVVVDQLEWRMRAQCDALTGALSRRAFIDAGHASFADLARSGRAGTAMMFDVDHFKAINDRFGHHVGDRVLTEIGVRIRAILRPCDLFGRLGGEEFGVLAPGLDEAKAMRLAERLRAAISVPGTLGLPTVTASFGLAPMRPGTDLDLALAEADTALYAAKRRGRNQCLLIDPAMRDLAA